MTAAQKAAKTVPSIIARVNDDAQTTRVPSATFITRTNGRDVTIVVDYSRTMNRR